MISRRLDDARRIKTTSSFEQAVNEWAAAALPTVERHLSSAQALRDRLDGEE